MSNNGASRQRRSTKDYNDQYNNDDLPPSPKLPVVLISGSSSPKTTSNSSSSKTSDFKLDIDDDGSLIRGIRPRGLPARLIWYKRLWNWLVALWFTIMGYLYRLFVHRKSSIDGTRRFSGSSKFGSWGGNGKDDGDNKPKKKPNIYGSFKERFPEKPAPVSCPMSGGSCCGSG